MPKKSSQESDELRPEYDFTSMRAEKRQMKSPSAWRRMWHRVSPTPGP